MRPVPCPELLAPRLHRAKHSVYAAILLATQEGIATTVVAIAISLEGKLFVVTATARMEFGSFV